MSLSRFIAACSAFSVFAVVASATVASAVDRDHGRSGPFLGGGGVYAFENFDADVSVDDSWGYYVRGGYRFNPWFALELNFEQYLGFDEKGGGGGGDTDIWLGGVNGKFFPFHGIIQPYALFGAYYTDVNPSASTGEEDDEGVSFRFAGGVDVYITRNWAITADAGYFLPIGGISDFAAIPIRFGVMYRFY
jgi:hypothetical protein